MSSSATEAPPALAEHERAAYFKAREKEEKDIGHIIIRKLLQKEEEHAGQPRRILLETAVETGYPLQTVQRVFWTIETRGQIRWEQGGFVSINQDETSDETS